MNNNQMNQMNNNQMMQMNNMNNNQMMQMNNMNNNQMMQMNNMNNNQMMQMNNMNNNINNNNQISNNGFQEQIEEFDFMKKQIKLYEERIKSLEKRIKQKDLEIKNLNIRLSSIFYNYQNMLSFNYNLLMMEQMKYYMNNSNQVNDNNKMIIQRNKNYPENITLSFVLLNTENCKISIQCKSNERLEEVITRFRYKLCKEDFCFSYFFNGKELNKDLTIDKSGLFNNAEIFVVDKNDENQIKKMRKMFPLKSKSDQQLNFNEYKKTITFTAATGHKEFINVSSSNKVGEAIKLYLKKIGVGENINSLFFLYNGERFNIDDQRTIEEAFPGNIINLYVIDSGATIGA
jgi:hypothetical protein